MGRVHKVVTLIVGLLQPLALSTAATFTPVASGLQPWELTSAAWGDVNGDGSLDLVVVAANPFFFSEVYLNNRDGTLTAAQAELRTAIGVRPIVADLNNDGSLDILLGTGGGPGTNENAFVYLNDGAGRYREVRTAIPSSAGAASAADYDGDGRVDVCLLMINQEGLLRGLDLFRNVGGTDFSGTQVQSNYVGDIDSGDYDRDGLPDLLLSGGIVGQDSFFAAVYRNTGGFGFTNVQAPLPRIAGSCRWGDLNNDGRLDTLFCGGYPGLGRERGIGYATQQSNGGFTGGVDFSLAPLDGQVAWGDFDNDGLLDFVVAGTTNQINQGLFTKVYRNTPTGFVEVANLTGINAASGGGWVGWADYDNDGDLDLLVSGSSEAGRFTQLYRNDSPVTNTPPSAPFGLTSVVTGTEVRLQWGAAADGQTPATGLTYNIRVGARPGGVDVVSPMSRPDGWRMVVQRGNSDHRLFSKVVGLKGGVYYWSVQAVDTAFAGGPFAPEATFVVPPAIQGITLQVDGTVRIAMLGAPNVAGYVFEGSTNLTSWAPVATLAADAVGQFSYVETNVSTMPARYYRVHSP